METFIIKCPGVVNDSALPKITELRIPMLVADSPTAKGMEISFNEASAVRMNKNKFYDAQGVEQSDTIPAAAFATIYPHFKVLDGGYFFIDKFDKLTKFRISALGAFNFDLRDVSYMRSLTNFDCTGNNVVHGTINNFANIATMTNLGVLGADVVGEMSFFNDATAMQDARLWVTSITGKLSEFKNSLSLTRLSCTSPDVDYDWQDLCDAQFANGRTSGQLRIESLASQAGDFRVQFTTEGWSVVL